MTAEEIEELKIEERKLRIENNNAKEDQQRYMVWFSAISVTIYIGVLMTDVVSLERLDHLSSIGNTWVLSNMGIIGAFIASNVFIKNGNNKQEIIMPSGKGTYGSKKGRPPKKPIKKPK